MGGLRSRGTDGSGAGWGVPTLLLGIISLLTLAPPLLGPESQAAAMELFAPLCHQMPERSFWLMGEPLAVCHRCTGIYFGLFAGALLWRAAGGLGGSAPFPRSEIVGRRARLVIVLAAAPAAVDWGAGLAGLWQSGPFVRAATGFWFGAGTGLLVTDGLRILTGRVLARIRRFYPTFHSR